MSTVEATNNSEQVVRLCDNVAGKLKYKIAAAVIYCTDRSPGVQILIEFELRPDYQ